VPNKLVIDIVDSDAETDDENDLEYYKGLIQRNIHHINCNIEEIEHNIHKLMMQANLL
jgi:hypothetical protein